MTARTGSLRIASWCLCGASFIGSSTPPDAVEDVHEAWRSQHVGEGHGPCSAQKARNARRRLEREALRAGDAA